MLWSGVVKEVLTNWFCLKYDVLVPVPVLVHASFCGHMYHYAYEFLNNSCQAGDWNGEKFFIGGRLDLITIINIMGKIHFTHIWFDSFTLCPPEVLFFNFRYISSHYR